MIAFLQGKKRAIDPTTLLLDVHGVGYEVKISLYTYAAIKNDEHIELYTHLSIKEDAHTLFGFKELEEKRLFLLLVSVSGVGPSTALLMLSSLPPMEVKQAIAHEDVRTIQGVKGIGAKTAQRLILELKDKINKDPALLATGNNSLNSHTVIRTEALAAMIALGYPKPGAEKTLDHLIKTNGNIFTVEELIKQALKSS